MSDNEKAKLPEVERDIATIEAQKLTIKELRGFANEQENRANTLEHEVAAQKVEIERLTSCLKSQESPAEVWRRGYETGIYSVTRLPVNANIPSYTPPASKDRP